MKWLENVLLAYILYSNDEKSVCEREHGSRRERYGCHKRERERERERERGIESVSKKVRKILFESGSR